MIKNYHSRKKVYRNDKQRQKKTKRNIKDIDTLVMQGGGSKGVIYIGAIKALEDKGILEQIDFFCGSSIGAFASFLLYLGYDSKYILSWVKSDHFITSIFGTSNPEINIYDIPSIIGVCSEYGVYNSMLLINLAYYHIQHSPLLKRRGRGTETFQDLYLASEGKIFACTGTNMNASRVYYFSYYTTPNMPVFIAMAITMCVPFIFTPIIWADSYWVDGGIIDNLPYPWVRHFKKRNNILCLGFTNQKCIDCEDYCEGCSEECIEDSVRNGAVNNYDTPYGKPPCQHGSDYYIPHFKNNNHEYEDEYTYYSKNAYKKQRANPYKPKNIGPYLPPPPPPPIDNFVSYINSFLRSIQKTYMLQPYLKCHSIFFVCDDDLTSFDFDLDYYKKKKYIEKGYYETKKYINKFKIT